MLFDAFRPHGTLCTEENVEFASRELKQLRPPQSWTSRTGVTLILRLILLANIIRVRKAAMYQQNCCYSELCDMHHLISSIYLRAREVWGDRGLKKKYCLHVKQTCQLLENWFHEAFLMLKLLSCMCAVVTNWMLHNTTVKTNHYHFERSEN